MPPRAPVPPVPPRAPVPPVPPVPPRAPVPPVPPRAPVPPVPPMAPHAGGVQVVPPLPVVPPIPADVPPVAGLPPSSPSSSPAKQPTLRKPRTRAETGRNVLSITVLPICETILRAVKGFPERRFLIPRPPTLAPDRSSSNQKRSAAVARRPNDHFRPSLSFAFCEFSRIRSASASGTSSPRPIASSRVSHARALVAKSPTA